MPRTGHRRELLEYRSTAAVNRGAHIGRLHRPYGTMGAA